MITDLQATRDLLADPAHWTKGAYARDAIGGDVSPRDPKATCFCMRGALDKITDYSFGRIFNVKLISRRANGRSMIDFNDDPTTTHADVLSYLDKAIAYAKENTDA